MWQLELHVPEWADQLHVADTERRCKFIERDHGGVASALLQAAYVLLAEAGYLGKLLLGQTLPQSDASHIPSDQLAHVHARRSADFMPQVYQL